MTGKKQRKKNENSGKKLSHRDSVLRFILRCKDSSHVDRQLEKQVQENKKYWTEVLRRVVAVTIFLGE